MSVVALATAMALPVVGALLVFSLMVGPASAARALTDRPLAAMLLSAAIAIVTVWAVDHPLLRFRLADRIFRRQPERTHLHDGADMGVV